MLNAQLKAAVGTIQASETHQTLKGFGASVAWYGNWITSHPNKETIYCYMFEELGLDILRLRNSYRGNPSNFATDTQEIVSQFYNYAVSTPQILMSSWSPPANLKSNGSTENGGTLIKIDDDYAYQDFAYYWIDALNAYDGMGVIPDYISIQNEPSFVASWESCVLNDHETTILAGYDHALQAVCDALQTLDDPPMLIGPEVLGIGYSLFQKYANRLNHDCLDGYAYHLYHGGDGNVNPDLFIPNLNAIASRYSDKPIFQTEYDYGGWFNTAWLMHNCLVHGNVSAYFYWGLIWENSGLVAVENPWSQGSWQSDQGFIIDHDYYAFWHYSKFLYSGYQRVTAYTDDDDIRLSSYINPVKSELVSVVLNVGQTDQSLTFDVRSFAPAGGEIFRTSETELGEFIDSFDGSKSINVPARSISTIIMSGSLGSVSRETDPLTSKLQLTHFPNPFNSTTQIRYHVPVACDVKVIVYDLRGREVFSLADEYQSAGSHAVEFSGQDLPSGTYLTRIEAGPQSVTKRMILLK